MAFNTMDIADFSTAKRNNLKHDLASNLSVRESQVMISAVRAGSVVVEAAVKGLENEAKARSVHHAIKEKASAGMLVSEAKFGPCVLKYAKVEDPAARKAREAKVAVS